MRQLLSQVDEAEEEEPDAEMDAEEAEEEEPEDDEEWEEEAEEELVLSVQPFTGAAHQLAPPTCVPFTGTTFR